MIDTSVKSSMREATEMGENGPICIENPRDTLRRLAKALARSVDASPGSKAHISRAPRPKIDTPHVGGVGLIYSKSSSIFRGGSDRRGSWCNGLGAGPPQVVSQCPEFESTWQKNMAQFFGTFSQLVSTRGSCTRRRCAFCPFLCLNFLFFNFSPVLQGVNITI